MHLLFGHLRHGPDLGQVGHHKARSEGCTTCPSARCRSTITPFIVAVTCDTELTVPRPRLPKAEALSPSRRNWSAARAHFGGGDAVFSLALLQFGGADDIGGKSVRARSALRRFSS
jgi:hypothetical protein